MKKWIVIVLVMLATAAAWAEEPVDKDLRLFMEYYEGDFNNHNQVHLEKGLPEEQQHPWHLGRPIHPWAASGVTHRGETRLLTP